MVGKRYGGISLCEMPPYYIMMSVWSSVSYSRVLLAIKDFSLLRKLDLALGALGMDELYLPMDST